MTTYHCAFCDNESRFVCVKCKKDICKDHAVYERYTEEEGGGGNWVCVDCHGKRTTTNMIVGVIAVIIFIIVLAVVIPIVVTHFQGTTLPFP
ncbi:MAG: hypothetical protein FK734_06725 [Asgard group archaeon]|nr:hypothetical protein [Asgard group archaeon]